MPNARGPTRSQCLGLARWRAPVTCSSNLLAPMVSALAVRSTELETVAVHYGFTVQAVSRTAAGFAGFHRGCGKRTNCSLDMLKES